MLPTWHRIHSTWNFYMYTVTHQRTLDLVEDLRTRLVWDPDRSRQRLEFSFSGCSVQETTCCLPSHSARIRASPFNFNFPFAFAPVNMQFRETRLWIEAPNRFPFQLLLHANLFSFSNESTVGNIDNMIGWKDDNNTVGSNGAAAKKSLQCRVLHVKPADAR